MKEIMHKSVTEQIGAHLHVALVYNPTINAGRSGSLFSTFQPWEYLEYLRLEPSVPPGPSISHVSHQAISHKHPPKFSMFLSTLNPAALTVPYSLLEVPKSPSSHSSFLLGYVASSFWVIDQKRHRSKEFS